MHRIFKVKCPECGTLCDYRVEFTDLHSKVKLLVYCDSEQGGCDELFALVVALKPMIYTAKIDGRFMDLQEIEK